MGGSVCSGIFNYETKIDTSFSWIKLSFKFDNDSYSGG